MEKKMNTCVVEIMNVQNDAGEVFKMNVLSDTVENLTRGGVKISTPHLRYYIPDLDLPLVPTDEGVFQTLDGSRIFRKV